MRRERVVLLAALVLSAWSGLCRAEEQLDKYGGAGGFLAYDAVYLLGGVSGFLRSVDGRIR